MMQLYWSPRSRSFTALWLMEETGQPYERVLTDIATGAQKKPARRSRGTPGTWFRTTPTFRIPGLLTVLWWE